MRATLLVVAVLLAAVAGCTPTRNASPLEPLAGGHYTELGWAAGNANDDDPNRSSYFRIVSIEQTPSGIFVTYDWKHGRMELHPLVIQELEFQGQVLAGTWTQDNASGPIAFTFDTDGRFLSGRWNDATNSTWYKAFLR